MVAVFPIYAVLDVSASTDPLISVYNQALVELVSRLNSEPPLAEAAYLSVITFSDEATLLVPLTNIGDIAQIPQLRAGGRTSYGSAFRLLRERIEFDVAELKTRAKRVYRPMAFFVTDGAPTDDWRIDYQHLTDDGFRLKPTIVTVGIGDVDVRTLLQIATRPDLAFVGRAGSSAETSVRGAFTLLAISFTSLRSSVTGSAGVPNPAAISTPEGLVQIPESFRPV